MNNGKININISGGSTNFGNISQGDGNINSVQEQSVGIDLDKAFSEFFSQLEKLASSSKLHEYEISDLRKDIVSLKKSLDSKKKSKETLGQVAKSLYEKYGWAVDALQKLFSVLM